MSHFEKKKEALGKLLKRKLTGPVSSDKMELMDKTRTMVREKMGPKPIPPTPMTQSKPLQRMPAPQQKPFDTVLPPKNIPDQLQKRKRDQLVRKPKFA